MRFAEESAGLAVRHVAAAATHEFGEHGEGRQVGLPSSQIAHDRADVGCIDSPGEEPACLHHLPACVVNRGTAVVDRADERDLIGDFGDSREDFGDLEAGNLGLDRFEWATDFGGGVGLHVPEVHVARRRG